MDLVLAQFVTGLAHASTLFLVAAGLTIIFGVTRVVNFAHGSLVMLGAYIAYSITTRLPSTPPAFFGGLLLAALAVALLGALVEMLLLRRIYAAPEIFQLLATFGVVLIVQDLVLWIWGPEDLFAPRAPGLKGSVELAGSVVPQYTVFLLVVGPLVFGLLWLLFRRTRWGIAVRAATQDGEMAAALGVNRAWLFTAVFALGSFLAGLAGALQIPRESVTLQMDLAVIVEAFVVVVVGGLGSIGGAFLASLLIGLLHAFGVWWLPQSTLVLAFVAMAVVLILRPYGLLGRALVATPPRSAAHAPFRAADRRLALALGLATVAALALPLLLRPVFGEYLLVVMTDIAILALFAASLQFFMGHGRHHFVRTRGVLRSRRLCERAAAAESRAAHGARIRGGAAGRGRRRRARRLVRAALAGRVRGHADARVRADPVVDGDAVDRADGRRQRHPRRLAAGVALRQGGLFRVRAAGHGGEPVAAAPRGAGAVRLRTARDARCAGARRCLRHRGDARAMAGVLRRRIVRGPCRCAQRVPQGQCVPERDVDRAVARRACSWCSSAAC